MAVERRAVCRTIGVVGAMFVLLGAGTEAQRGGPAPELTPPAIGARIGWDWDESHWSVGGQARLMLPFLPGLEFSPSGDVFFMDDQKQWQINLDAAIQLLPMAYAGAGFAIAYDSLPTSSGPTIESGYNVFAGVNAPTLDFPVRPFAEARWTVINRFVRPFRVVAGLDVRLGGLPSRRR